MRMGFFTFEFLCLLVGVLLRFAFVFRCETM